MKILKAKNLNKINTQSIKNDDYIHFASRSTCLARDEIWVTWLINHGAKKFIDLPNGLIYDYYIEKKSSLELLKMLANKIRRDWCGHLRRYKLLKKEIYFKAKKLSESVKTKDNKIILKNYFSFLNLAYEFCEFVWGAWAVIYHIEPEVIKEFSDKIEEIIALDEPIEYFNLQKKLLNSSLLDTKEKYGWLNIYSPHDTPYSISKLGNIKKKLKRQDLIKQFKNYKKNKIEFKKLLKTIKSAKLKRDIIIMHKYAFLKTDRIDSWKRAMFALRPFFEYLVSLNKKISLSDSCNLFIEEVITFLKYDTLPEINQLKMRSKNKALYIFSKNKIDAIYVKDKIREVFLKLTNINNKLKFFKGISACKGRARGKAKIIINIEDLKKIKKGDIFVAQHTFPKYTLYMIISSAIITDEGGLTNHAAIVSREYNKPCIVGTKIATRVLKDGDLVEVDANKGIVKILKKGLTK